jgi:hypothetical protein
MSATARSARLLAVALAALTLAGIACEQVEPLPEPKVEIRGRRDDGVVSANKALLPDSAHGFAYGWNAAGGIGVSTVSGDTFWYRTLYRLNAADWDSGEVSFFVVCRAKRGSPGPIDLYIVPDFDSFPDYTTRTNVTALFSRNAGLAPAASAEPADGEWFRFVLPDSAVRVGRGASGWIAFLLAVNEDGVAPGNLYELSTWESTYIDDYRPYLYW